MDELVYYARHFAFGTLLISLCLTWSWIVNRAQRD